MKKKSTPFRRNFSEGGFFNLRVLFGLCVGMTGISLALFAANPLGRSSSPSAARVVQPQQKYKVNIQPGWDPLVPAAFDCSNIHQLGIVKQDNLQAEAIMIFFCHSSKGTVCSSGSLSKLD